MSISNSGLLCVFFKSNIALVTVITINPNVIFYPTATKTICI